MERRGIYRKGSAGHVRNVNSFRVYRQKFKKWRFPLTAFLALMLVFGIAPVVGEEFQASLLTAPDNIGSLIDANPEQARKVMLVEIHDFVRDCERFKMDVCADEGRALLTKITEADAFLKDLVPVIDKFESSFAKELSRSACRFDLWKEVSDAKSFQKKLVEFVARYGDEFDDAALPSSIEKLNSAVADLDAFVESCGKL